VEPCSSGGSGKGYRALRSRVVTAMCGHRAARADIALTLSRPSSDSAPTEATSMATPSSNPLEGKDDQQKAHTPDTLRNDDAKWKDKDMPEQDTTATPDDYERPAKP
jgi:hypothetical protein